MLISLVFLFVGFGAVIVQAQSESWFDDSKLAFALENKGNFAEEETMWRRTLATARKQLDPMDKRLASMLTNLASVLHTERRDLEAEPFLRSALPIAEASGDKQLLASVLNGLGINLFSRRELARAEPVLRRAQALFDESEGVDSLNAAKASYNLASVYCDSHEYSRAQIEMARALETYEKVFPPNDPTLAMAFDNMFTIFAEDRRAGEGEPYLRRALAIGEKAFPGSANMARIESGWAAIEAQRGNMRAAALVLEKVIATEERLLGPSSPELAKMLSNYSIVLRQLNQKAEAKRVQTRADSILKSLH